MFGVEKWNHGISKKPFKNKKTILLFLIGVMVFFIFLILYLVIGYLLSKTTAFKEYDNLFQIDTPRVIGDMTNFLADHYRTNFHPIYVILVNPLGLLVNKITSYVNRFSNVNIAILLNGFFGATGVTLCFVFFCKFKEKIIDALLFTILFGFSSSQLIFSTIPETSSLAVCSLIVTYIVFIISLKKKKISLIAWILAGIFSLGVTTTNFIQTIICFGFCLFIFNRKSGSRYLWKQTGLFFLGVISITILLSIIQKAIYTSSSYFFFSRLQSGDIGIC